MTTTTRAQATTTQPTRATWKGHGNPTTGVYYGSFDKPAAEGVLVTISTRNGGTGLNMTDASGKVVGGGGVAGKFWLAPAPAAEPVADVVPISRARKTGTRGPAKTGNPQADRAQNAATLGAALAAMPKPAAKAKGTPAAKAKGTKAPAKGAPVVDGPARGDLRRAASLAAKGKGGDKLTGRYAIGDVTEDGWTVRWVNTARLLLARETGSGLTWCARMADGTDLPAATGKDAYELAGAYAVLKGVGQARSDNAKWAARMGELKALLASLEPKAPAKARTTKKAAK